MANTPEGGVKLRQTMIAKYGSLEDYRKHMALLGSIGGKNGRGHKFAHGKASPAVAGAKGGRISRRRKQFN
jgi:hypothetical protein